MKDDRLRIVRIQRFSTHDGPGIRTVVFAKGCPLDCAWCHNPETKSAKPQIFFNVGECINCGACVRVCAASAHVFTGEMHNFIAEKCIGCHKCADVCVTGAIEALGRDVSVNEIMRQVEKDREFYGATGGLTLSGGEPMRQPRASTELLCIAKARGIKTAVETCGYFDGSYVSELAAVTDLFLWDIKDCNGERHKRYTGVSNEKIIGNLFLADKFAKEIVLRCIIVNGVNTDKEHLDGIVNLYRRLNHCSQVQLLPYHAYAGGKTTMLGLTDNGKKEWCPPLKSMKSIRNYLLSQKVKVTDA